MDGYASYREAVSTWRPKACKRCGAKADDLTVISKNGYCRGCSLARVTESVTSMITRTGPHYERFVLARHPTGPKARALGVGGTPSPIENERTDTADA